MEPISSVDNLTDRVYEEIKRGINEGDLAQGSLHSVYRLAEALNVSRTPVREALLKLAEQGTVRFERNRGVRILPTSIHDLEEMFSLRLLLEIPATRRAVANLTEEVVSELSKALDGMEATAQEDDVAGMLAFDRRFHSLIMETSGNRRLARFVDDLREQIVARGASTAGRTRTPLDIVAEHRRLYDAIKSRDAERAAELMLSHLVNTGKLLLSQEGKTHPAEFVMSWAQHLGVVALHADQE